MLGRYFSKIESIRSVLRTDAIKTINKHLQENDKHIQLLFDKNEICSADDIRDEQEALEDLFKR